MPNNFTTSTMLYPSMIRHALLYSTLSCSVLFCFFNCILIVPWYSFHYLCSIVFCFVVLQHIIFYFLFLLCSAQLRSCNPISSNLALCYSTTTFLLSLRYGMLCFLFPCSFCSHQRFPFHPHSTLPSSALSLPVFFSNARFVAHDPRPSR